MELRAAVCDDSPADARFVADILGRWAANRGHSLQTEIFSSAERFMFRYAEDKAWDLLLLDIEMGPMDGVTLAKQIRRDNETVPILFITGYSDYMGQGYEVSALHYLLKPVKAEKLMEVLDRAVSRLDRAERFILLPVEGETRRLPVGDIRYAEAFSHSVAVVTAGERLSVKLPISRLEAELGEGFVRCHRSYLVGLKHIARLSRTELVLDSGKVLPISRTAGQAVHKAFVAFYRGKNDEAF